MGSGEAELHPGVFVDAACHHARGLGVSLSAVELQAEPFDSLARQGLREVRHLDLSYAWMQEVVRRKQLISKRVLSDNNMASDSTSRV